jgi:hypothetical protein
MKLTDEQIEAAAKALHSAANMQRPWDFPYPTRAYEELVERHKNEWRELARSAAPFLQAPWEPPTPSEVSDVYAVAAGTSPRYDFVLRRLSDAIAAFVDKRNAKLSPKPVDPRREKIITAIFNYPGEHFERLADRILAALDAKD